MNVLFSANGWDAYLSWTSLGPRTANAEIVHTILALLENIRRSPFTGLGKPEPLRGRYQGYWSRRITQEHRLIYRVRGVAGFDQLVEVVSCRGHY